MKDRLVVPPAARRLLGPIGRLARRLGLPAYVVGGPVRDWLLRRATLDLDVAVEGDPAPLAALCARELGAPAEAFGQFGTWRIKKGALRVDLATTRREDYPEPASLPKVSTPAPIVQDLLRRDFTINAMALPLVDSGAAPIVDPYGGLADLEAGVLRVLHDQSFRDDPTRVFRAARYLCRLGLRPHSGLAALAREALEAGHASRLSRHRLAQELARVLAEDDPSCALRRLDEWRYLALLEPGLEAPPRALKDVPERLAAMALQLGAKGEAFLSSLPVDHALSAPAREALKLSRQSAASRSGISRAAARALRAVFPRLPASAVRPLLLRGDDLERRGIAPGPAMGRLLDEAARLQWAGRLSSRSQALAWLGKKTPPRPLGRPGRG